MHLSLIQKIFFLKEIYIIFNNEIIKFLTFTVTKKIYIKNILYIFPITILKHFRVINAIFFILFLLENVLSTYF